MLLETAAFVHSSAADRPASEGPLTFDRPADYREREPGSLPFDKWALHAQAIMQLRDNLELKGSDNIGYALSTLMLIIDIDATPVGAFTKQMCVCSPYRADMLRGRSVANLCSSICSCQPVRATQWSCLDPRKILQSIESILEALLTVDTRWHLTPNTHYALY